MRTLPPGSTIGILGGGQLGRMLAIAAANLGYRTHIFAPEAGGPAADVTAGWTRGDYADREALARFAAEVDVLTFEFENVVCDPLESLGEEVAIFPPPRALALGQDRLNEKTFVAGLGGRTAPWWQIDRVEDLRPALADLGTPAILKTRRFGYDGKGQVRITDAAEAAEAWEAIGGKPAILEGCVAFEHEFSILLVRGQDGDERCWPAPDNVHVDGILATSTVPAGGIVHDQAPTAARLTGQIADALDYVGVLACEFFAGPQGPVFNEMAPRVHNSGHWTIEGARCSQFENHIRAICGLPLGTTELTAPRVQMENLIGEAAGGWHEILATPGAHLHLYGKREARPGRKMGHVTRLG
jgi:5-(carboxyamino)imidazole ribonucleotide synthase